VRVQSAKSAAGISSSVAATAESTRANKAGVNLDEEAARLIQFQQSYQAAAKMLQVAQSIFDTLLQTAGG
jgi:flagellar hook-associated protein 1 FlgK